MKLNALDPFPSSEANQTVKLKTKASTLKQPAVRFRRLKRHELVQCGDYARQGNDFRLWEGQGGFQAGSFVRRMYRKVPARLKSKEPVKNITKTNTYEPT